MAPSPRVPIIRLLQPLDHPRIGSDSGYRSGGPRKVFDAQAEIIVTQRSAVPDTDTADRLAAHARRTGAKLLFDLDDDLLRVPASHPDAERLRPQSRVIRRMLGLADAVWVSTSGLAARLSKIRPDAIVMENRLDERIWLSTFDRRHHTGMIRSASFAWERPRHDRDFALIEPVLMPLKADYGDRISIDVLGMTRPRGLLPGLNRIGPSAQCHTILSRLRRLGEHGPAGLAYRPGSAARYAVQPEQVADQGAGIRGPWARHTGFRCARLPRIHR